MTQEELFTEILEDFKTSFKDFPGVLAIDLKQNMIRVLAKDDLDIENFPATYLHKNGHMGISVLREFEKNVMDTLGVRHEWTDWKSE